MRGYVCESVSVCVRVCWYLRKYTSVSLRTCVLACVRAFVGAFSCARVERSCVCGYEPACVCVCLRACMRESVSARVRSRLR